MFISRLIDRIFAALGITTSSAILERRNANLREALLKAKFEIRELKRENIRIEDEAESAWEMLEEIKKADKLAMLSKNQIAEAFEELPDDYLSEFLAKNKPYGEA